MLKLIEILSAPIESSSTPHQTLTLPYERRIISRQRVRLDDGTEAGLFLPRGASLLHGAILQSEQGEQVHIQAALETVSTVYCTDSLLLTRACYHLGNRHVPVEISPHRLRYLHDHVLDDMLRGLGLAIVVEQATFEPEAGAYSAGHSHGHSHGPHPHAH